MSNRQLGAVTAPHGARILQYVVQEYDPSAAQALTTSYADIDGSDYAFTPVSSSSNILYKYQFHVASAQNAGIAHFKLLVDGVAETETAFSIGDGDTVLGDYPQYPSYIVQSWGAGTAKTMKLQGREYGATIQMKLHGTYNMDGGASEVIVRATLEIIEIEP